MDCAKHSWPPFGDWGCVLCWLDEVMVGIDRSAKTTNLTYADVDEDDGDA